VFTDVTDTLTQDGPPPGPSDSTAILLAQIQLNGSGAIESNASIDNSVRTLAGAKVAPLEIGTVELAASAVTTEKILDGSVTLGKLAANSVDASKIVDGTVGSAELGANAVVTAKILDGAVTLGKLAGNSVDASKIVDGSVGTAELANLAVTNAKLADAAITNAKLADASVSNSKLAGGSITGDKLAAASVGATALAPSSVGIGILAASLVWDGSFTVNANSTHGFFSGPPAQTPGTFLISVTPTTLSSSLTWEVQNFCNSDNTISRAITVKNAGTAVVAFALKAYFLSLG
jgi:hypothetical protein